MSPPPSPAVLAETLRRVARRYGLPPIDAAAAQSQQASAATALAIAIEQARLAMAGGQMPDAAIERDFIEALARMIRQAMQPGAGDPAFQAMVLRHRVAQVREYASLSAHADRDRRAVHAAVNAIAHPARQQRLLPGPLRQALAGLHAAASSASWPALHRSAQALLDMTRPAGEPALDGRLQRLLDDPALRRLRRLEALASDDRVRQYRALWDRNGPRSGSPAAQAQGLAAQSRGAAVEASAMRALQALARRLDEAAGAEAAHRVVTSMRVPAAIPASPERAKSEWDVVLLRRAPSGDDAPAWDVCLLVEAKASVEAATTDLPRLLRGVRLLAQAEAHAVYPFATRQGTVRLRGASLSTLASDEAGLASTVVYCCDAPAETASRLLGAASRMQLLSAPASLAFAGKLADKQPGDPQSLAPVWHELLASPRWAAVLHQYPMLRQVRGLMVHVDDLWAAIEGPSGDGTAVAGAPG